MGVGQESGEILGVRILVSVGVVGGGAARVASNILGDVWLGALAGT